VFKTTGDVACPHCGSTATQVRKTRGLIKTDAIRRTRECASCGNRFPTSETVSAAALEAARLGQDPPASSAESLAGH